MDPSQTGFYAKNYSNTPNFRTDFPIYDLDYEHANFKAREEDYNRYIAKLNQAYAELDAKFKESVKENNFLRQDNDSMRRSIDVDMKNLLAAYTDLQEKVKEVERDNRHLVMEVKKRDERIFELESETSSQRLEAITLRDRLDKVENSSTTDIGDLNRIVSDQKNEIGELRRKLNLALETKRKLESEVENSRFTMETVRIKYENELREKELRTDQAVRSVEREIESRTREMSIQLSTFDKLQHDNVVFEKKNKELINEIALHINAQKLLNQELDHRARELETVRRELEVYKGPRKNPVVCNFNPSSHISVIKICNRRFQAERMEYLFTIWRLRYHLLNESKFRLREEAKDAINEFEDEPKSKGKTSTKGLGATQSQKIRYDFDNNRDIGIATSLADGVLRTLKYMRERANGIIFEIFIRSANNAEQKKSNSLILFSINLKEIDDQSWKSLSLLLDSYTILRRLLKTFHPKFLKIKKPAGTGVLEKKLSYSLGKLQFQTGTVKDRDETNRWIENSLVYIVNKKKVDKDPNKDFMFLYRVLAIRYRVQYPMKGKEFDIEEDLKIYMEHKILSALHKLLKNNPKENQPIFDPNVINDPEIENLARP